MGPLGCGGAGCRTARVLGHNRNLIAGNTYLDQPGSRVLCVSQIVEQRRNDSHGSGTAHGALNLAGSLVGFALGLQLGIAGHFTGCVLDSALGPLRLDSALGPLRRARCPILTHLGLRNHVVASLELGQHEEQELVLLCSHISLLITANFRIVCSRYTQSKSQLMNLKCRTSLQESECVFQIGCSLVRLYYSTSTKSIHVVIVVNH